MRRRILTIAGIAIFSCLTLMQAQRSYMPFHDDDDSPAPLPPDANEKTEWAFARLIYPSGRFYGTRGYATIDSPKADRQFSLGVRRLTRIHTRSKESTSAGWRRGVQMALALRRGNRSLDAHRR